MKLIVDLMIEGGTLQRWSISDTAEYGDYCPAPRISPRSRRT